ncbi:MAG: tetratricopeptide repeat protein [Gemmatimonadaceae bacterium]
MHFIRPALAPLLLFAAIAACTGRTTKTSAPSPNDGSALPPGVEAISLLGDTLRTFPLSDAARKTYERQLAQARRASERAPENVDSIISLGRRIAYLGRLREAIDVYSRGISLYPKNPWLYRHRGHRYVSVRDFDRAITDLERATTLIAGTADEVEPDGQPNARNTPIGTLHSNVAYHLGLAYYLKGDYAHALPVYQRDFAAATNEDRRASVAYWLYLTLRKLGRDADATAILRTFGPETHVIENVEYVKLLRLFKGELPADSVFAGASSGEMSVGDATAAYGVAQWNSLAGRSAEADRIYRRLIAGGQWGSFGYIAAEAELARSR